MNQTNRGMILTFEMGGGGSRHQTAPKQEPRNRGDREKQTEDSTLTKTRPLTNFTQQTLEVMPRPQKNSAKAERLQASAKYPPTAAAAERPK